MGATWKPNPAFTKNTRDAAAAKPEAEKPAEKPTPKEPKKK